MVDTIQCVFVFALCGNGRDCGNGHDYAVVVPPTIDLSHEISVEVAYNAFFYSFPMRLIPVSLSENLYDTANTIQCGLVYVLCAHQKNV